MKISIDKNVVELVPENAQETGSLENLWRVIVDCLKYNKKLVPIGEYVPSKENMARFFIEGIPGGKTESSEQICQEDCTYSCIICNKYKALKGGDYIPYCCGRVMEAI